MQNPHNRTKLLSAQDSRTTSSHNEFFSLFLTIIQTECIHACDGLAGAVFWFDFQVFKLNSNLFLMMNDINRYAHDTEHNSMPLLLCVIGCHDNFSTRD